MPHFYYFLNEKGMENHAIVCDFGAKCLEKWLGVEPQLKLSHFTSKYPFWSGLDRDIVFSDGDKTISTQHKDWLGLPHMELGGINGTNAFSFRKLTKYITNWEGNDCDNCDKMNDEMSDWLETRNFCLKPSDENAKIHYETQVAQNLSIMEMVQNSVCAGQKLTFQ